MNSTEKKLIDVIAHHYLGDNSGKITLEEISRRAGISRQAFNQYYSHLKPYAQGHKPIAELINVESSDGEFFLKKSQDVIDKLRAELKDLKDIQEFEVSKIKDMYITTLMNKDNSIFEARDVGVTLEKLSLHNDLLVKKIHALEHEVNQHKSELLLKKSTFNEGAMTHGKVDLSLSLASIYKKFHETGDLGALEEEKFSALERALNKVKLACGKNDTVIVFLERYICSFKKFFDEHVSDSVGFKYYINLPIYNHTELKILLKRSDVHTPIEIYLPFTNNDAIKKAQRTFQFRDIPDIEFQSADSMDFPGFKDGFKKICYFEISQGD